MIRSIARMSYRCLAGRFMFGPFLNWYRMKKASSSSRRRLEIGTYARRLPRFESLSIVAGRHVDYVLDASKPLPFATGTFDIVYASHVLEHIAWYDTAKTLAEWVRILRVGGSLEIFLPDGLKICKAVVKHEKFGLTSDVPDGWLLHNPSRDPCLWASGRMFYGNTGFGSWHKAMFTPRYLAKIMREAGLAKVKRLRSSQARSVDHGWINLGMRGVKV